MHYSWPHIQIHTPYIMYVSLVFGYKCMLRNIVGHCHVFVYTLYLHLLLIQSMLVTLTSNPDLSPYLLSHQYIKDFKKLQLWSLYIQMLFYSITTSDQGLGNRLENFFSLSLIC